MTMPAAFLHITAAAHLPAIRREGLRGGSYLISAEHREIAAYYADVIRDEGHEPVELRIDGAGVDPSALEPDRPGIAEPLTGPLGLTEEAIIHAWSRCAGGWLDSLELIGTCRSRAPIAATAITFPRSDLGPRP